MALLRPNALARFRVRTRRWAAWGLIALLGVAAVPHTRAAEAAISAENQIKAVFLFNFIQFVKWPARAFATPQSPIVIGVLGEDPFGPYLDGFVQGEKIGDRPIVVRRYQRGDDIMGCHLLFVSRSETAQVEQIVAQLKTSSILTVGDTDNFNRQGGMVRLATEKGKIQLLINVAAAKTAELTISTKILAHARIFEPGRN